MNIRNILALLLILIGVMAFMYQGITYTTRQRVVDVGPVKADIEKTHTIPIEPIVGGLALAGGITILILSRKSAA